MGIREGEIEEGGKRWKSQGREGETRARRKGLKEMRERVREGMRNKGGE